MSAGGDLLATVAALRDRGARDARGQFIIEGLKFLLAAAATRRTLDGLVLARELATSHAVGLARRLARDAPLIEVDASAYRALSLAHEPSGVLAVVRQRWHEPGRAPGPRDLWLALSRVRSPGNLGTLLRTCDAAGASGLLALDAQVDPHHPTCVRASMGSLLGRRLARFAGIAPLRRWLRRRGGVLVGASPAATRDYREVSYRRPVAFLLGDERGGIPPDDADACDVLVRIPMAGALDSLNIAVAGSLLLYEAANQRAPARRPG